MIKKLLDKIITVQLDYHTLIKKTREIYYSMAITTYNSTQDMIN